MFIFNKMEKDEKDYYKYTIAQLYEICKKENINCQGGIKRKAPIIDIILNHKKNNNELDPIFQNLPKELLGVIAKQESGANALLRLTSKETKKIIEKQNVGNPVCDWDYVKKYLIDEILKFYKQLIKQKDIGVNWIKPNWANGNWSDSNLIETPIYNQISYFEFRFDILTNSKRFLKNNDELVNYYLETIKNIKFKLNNFLKKNPLLNYISKLYLPNIFDINNFLKDKRYDQLQGTLAFQVERYTIIGSWNADERKHICDMIYGIEKEAKIKIPYPLLSTKIEDPLIISVDRIIPNMSEIIKYLENSIKNNNVKRPYIMNLYSRGTISTFYHNEIFLIEYIPKGELESYHIKIYFDKEIEITDHSKIISHYDEIYLNNFVDELFKKEHDYVDYAMKWVNEIYPQIKNKPTQEAIDILKKY